MSARKLQQEFDRTNKKISEGLTVFDDIYEKLLTTEISSQKEKLESDLKKEIKKLQRLRDQLKSWLGDSSIKLDKNILQENRTRIEHAMDYFKDLEKSSKIKQFSNEGLELQSQKSKYSRFGDIEEGRKLDSLMYIADTIDNLNQQNEALELEIHQATLQLKKTKSSNSGSIQGSIDDFKYKVERNNSHLTRLEGVLRNIQNDNLDPGKIDEIKDDLDYYVENNQEEDYVEYDDFYDQLEIPDGNMEVVGNLSNSLSQDINEEDEKEESSFRGNENSSYVEDTSAEEKVNAKDMPPETKEQSSTAEMKKPEGATPQNQEIPLPGGTNTRKSKPAVPNTNQGAQHELYSTIASANTSSPPHGKPDHGVDQKMKAESLLRLNSTEVNKNLTDSPISHSKGQSAAAYLAESIGANKHEQQEADNETGARNQQQLSPGRKDSSDSINRLVELCHSRLNNPLPYLMMNQMLENSLLNCPDSFDAEKPRQYQPTNMHPSSIDYPQEPMYELNSSHTMSKFDNDTLFFCFYYSDDSGDLAKWNAAKELSKRCWIFNTESKQWFLKDIKSSNKTKLNPKANGRDSVTPIEQKPEEDNYKYFDYEKTWLIRRRENFSLRPECRQTF